MTAAAADKRLTRSDLSPDQRRVFESIRDWLQSRSGPPVLTVGGYAGTGKSTLLGMLAAEGDLLAAYICFTGRASSILGRKLHTAGIGTTNRSQSDNERTLGGRWGHLFYSPFDPEATRPFCGTIHRLLYRPLVNFETEELYGWEKRERLDRDYKLIVLDEASMVDTKMVADIVKHGIRVLAVGDHGQLPPVMGDGSLMLNPTLRLEKIHRQAEGSPIIQLSRIIREEHRLDRSLADGRRLVFGSANDLRRRVFVDAIGQPRLDTAFLCWRNQTREHINRSIREYLGYTGQPPQKGEPVICLRNYPPIYNGMRGLLTETATYPYPESWWLMRAFIEFPDEGIESMDYEVCRDQFHRHDTFKSIEDLAAKGIKVYSMSEAGRLFDFGYAMTVHKSQGSQFPHAIVVADWRSNYEDERTRRLAYTAVTRASERLTVLT
jgi:exodeoxyribonuclease-5